jgi:hypothetical protein
MTFDLDNMNINIDKEEAQTIEYTYNGKRYMYKISKSGEFYNEIVAEKIANRLDIPCCHYILTHYNDKTGVSTELFDRTNYIDLYYILKCVYGKVTYHGLLDEKRHDYKYKTKNNLEDIWYALDTVFATRKNSQEIVEDLMSKIVKVFLFDMIIANSDRHAENIGFIVTENSVDLAPLFDNDFMLSEFALYDHDYSVYVEGNDYLTTKEFINRDNNKKYPNTLEKFFNISATEYEDEIKEMLEVISKESLEDIFSELEQEDVYIPQLIKNKMIDNLSFNKKYIEDFLAKKNNSIKH